MNPNNPSHTPMPPRPQKPSSSNTYGGDIRVPELEKKQALEEQAKFEEQQRLRPQTADAEGLNSSGLPSSEAYYQKKAAPLHTSAITPIVESSIWIKVIAVGVALAGALWMKEAVDGLRFQSGFISGLLHFIQLLLSYFFFVLPAYKLWILTKEIDQLRQERNESTAAAVLYAHARIWKYGGLAVTGAAAFLLASVILKKVAGLLTI